MEPSTIFLSSFQSGIQSEVMNRHVINKQWSKTEGYEWYSKHKNILPTVSQLMHLPDSVFDERITERDPTTTEKVKGILDNGEVTLYQMRFGEDKCLTLRIAALDWVKYNAVLFQTDSLLKTLDLRPFLEGKGSELERMIESIRKDAIEEKPMLYRIEALDTQEYAKWRSSFHGGHNHIIFGATKTHFYFMNKNTVEQSHSWFTPSLVRYSTGDVSTMKASWNEVKDMIQFLRKCKPWRMVNTSTGRWDFVDEREEDIDSPDRSVPRLISKGDDDLYEKHYFSIHLHILTLVHNSSSAIVRTGIRH